MRTATKIAAVVLVGVAVSVGGYLVLMPNDQPPRRADPANLNQVTAGADIYGEHCASCHGLTLAGEADWRRPRSDGSFPAPPHDESGHTWHHPDAQLFEITKLGGKPYNPRSTMPAFSGVLSDEEIWSVLAYIKSRWPDSVRERQRAVTVASEER